LYACSIFDLLIETSRSAGLPLRQSKDIATMVVKDTIEIVPLDRPRMSKVKTIMAEAFLEEPGAVVTIRRDPEKRLPILKVHFGAEAEAALPKGLSGCALFDGEVAGVMIITGPGRGQIVSTFDMAKLALQALFSANLGMLWRSVKSSLEDAKHRPKGPNYYLEVLAVAPKFQGKGIGGAMLSKLTDFADGDGLATYLSTTEPKTVPLYKRHGFQIISETSELNIPNYHMTRKPKASS
jgi:GNAT superfamily N-acetyltransferase